MTPRRTRWLALLVLCATALVTAYFVRRGSFSIVPLVGSAAIGSALFLLLSRTRTRADAVPMRPETASRIRRLLATLFFLTTAGSIGVLAPVLNEKPIAYYVLAAASAAALGSFVLLASTRRETSAAIGMVVVLAMNLLGSNLLAFPVGIGGADSSTHIYFLVAPIVSGGAIPPLGDGCGFIYATFPLHHLLVASGALALGVAPTTAYYAIAVAVMLLPVLVAFLVARRLFGVRTGLLAATLLASASYFVGWASHAAPVTYSLPLIGASVLVLLKLVDLPRARLLVAALPIGLALILTHPYSSLIFGFILAGIVVAHRVAERNYQVSTWGPSVVGVVFAFTLLIDWTNYSCLVTKSLGLATGWFSAFGGDDLLSSTNVNDELPLSVILANTVGDSFLFALAAVGFLALLSRRLVARHMLVVGPVVALLALAAIGLLTKLEYILPNRIYVFLQFVGLAPLAAFGIHYGVRRDWGAVGGGRKAASVLVTGLLIGGIVFASSTSIIAGFETSPFVGDRPYVKLYATRYEEHAADWMCTYARAAPRVATSPSLHGLARQQIIGCYPALLEGDLTKLDATGDGMINTTRLTPGTFIVFSYFDLDPGFLAGTTGVGQTGSGIYGRLVPSAPAELDRYDKLYDGGPVQVFRVGS